MSVEVGEYRLDCAIYRNRRGRNLNSVPKQLSLYYG